MRYALHDDPALDARLRAKLTAQLPQQPDLWPQIAARLPAVPSHRRRAFPVLVAAAIASALLMGAAVLHGFSVYDTATGQKIDLDAGEAYVPGDGSASFEMEFAGDRDPNWRSKVHDDRVEWPQTWDKQVCEYDENGQVIASSTPLLDFLNAAQFGQLIGQIEGRADGGFSGSLDYAAYLFDALPQTETILSQTEEDLWLPTSLPDRFTFAHGSMYPYLTPKQLKAIGAPSLRTGDGWAAAIWDMPAQAAAQLDGIALYFYGPDDQRVIYSSYLAESADMLLTGSPEMEITELTMDGFVNATMQVDQNAYYNKQEVSLRFCKPIKPVQIGNAQSLWKNFSEAAPDSTLLAQAADWADDTPITARYRVFNVDIIGMSQKEIRALLRQVSANSAEE